MSYKSAKDIKKSENFKVLIYSKPGTGKTSAIKHLKGKTLVLDLDHSSEVLADADDIFYEQIDRTEPSASFAKFIKIFPENIHEFDNLVIDNISCWEKDWFVEQGRTSFNGINNELSHYNTWGNYFIRAMSEIFMLPRKHNASLNIVITAWEDTQDVNLASGQIVTQYVPQIRKQVLTTLLGLVSVVGRLQINENTGARGVILEGNDGLYAKNRLDNRKACKVEDLFNFGDVEVK